MLSLYRNNGATLGGYKALTLNTDKEDITLSGKYGEIWAWSPTIGKAMLVYPSGYEVIRTFDIIKDLNTWIQRIGYLGIQSDAAYYANNPNERIMAFGGYYGSIK